MTSHGNDMYWHLTNLGRNENHWALATGTGRGALPVNGGVYIHDFTHPKPALIMSPVNRALTIASATFSSLGTSSNGTFVYCSDCVKGSHPCSGSGAGTFAFRVNGAWICF